MIKSSKRQEKPERKCKWTECWWSAVTVPGECSKKQDMGNPHCHLFLDETEKIKKWKENNEDGG